MIYPQHPPDHLLMLLNIMVVLTWCEDGLLSVPNGMPWRSLWTRLHSTFRYVETPYQHSLLHTLLTPPINTHQCIIQRVFRGYLGRLYYTILRTEIAQFIAIVRFQEADADEEEYWREHPWSRFKHDQIAWMRKDLTIYKMFVARNAEDYGAPTGGQQPPPLSNYSTES